MSFNQSRRDKKEDSQFKKSARLSSFNQQRISNHSSKQSNDAQHVRESRAGVSFVNSTVSTAACGGENGSHVQPQQNGSASNPTKLTGSQSGAVKKNATSQTTSKTSNEISESKSGIVQNNATSKPTLKTSDANASSTPFKDLREQHNTFPLQFGSLCSGFQIPRISLAPSNLEGQIPNQAQYHSFKSVPSGSVLPVPRQLIPKSDSNVCDKLNTGKSNPEPETKKEMQVSAGPPLIQNQKPSVISHRASIESMSLVPHIANASNVNEVQVHDSISASSGAKDVAIQPPLGSLTQVIDSRPKESLSSSNSIKPNNKVSGNKELIQLSDQVGFHSSQDLVSQNRTSYSDSEVSETIQTSESNAAERGGSSTSDEGSRAEFSVEPVSSHAEVDSTKDNNVLSNSITHGYKTSLIIASSCQSDSNKNTEMGRANLQSDPNFIPFVEDKPVVDINKRRNTSTRGKKKRKEILRKADAAGTTSDLYMAYKESEDKKETVMSADSSNGNLNMNHESAGFIKEEAVLTKKDVQNKLEPDDWEDAVDISIVKLKHEDGSGDMAKKYSRDFLLKFAEKFMDLPDGFEITPNIKALISTNHGSRSVNSANLGKMDKPSGVSQLDHRATTVDDRLFSSGRDSHLHSARPTQGAINGALKNSRAYIGSQGKIQRNGSSSDRWQRDINFQLNGLISPTPLQMRHRTEKKYEVGKVTDEEETKQRQMKAILNKLTPQNFEKLFEQVKAVTVDNSKTLSGVISQIFDKALMEPTFCEMYANFCLHLAGELPDFSDDNQKITFKRLLLNKCQEEFERDQEESDEINKVSEMQPSEEQEAKRLKARRRMLGNIRLIGELYKKKMITEKIMHECIRKLLSQYQNPDEEDIEALCKLMSTIGEMIDHPKAKGHMDAYFDRMTKLSNNMKLSSRVRFMLKDAIDLRKDKWQLRRKVEGPKKIDEVHRDAVQERQAQTSRLGRGPGINASLRRGTSMDFGSRASALLPSPNAQAGGFQGRQDIRFEGKQQSCEAKAFPVSLPRRPISDDAITLGPHSNLARGMSSRGPRSVSSTSLADLSLPNGNNSQRMTAALSSNSKGDITSRNLSQEHGFANGYMQLGNIDRCLGRSQSLKYEQPALTPNDRSEVMSKERLREKSIAAIREYYSARDEKEVTLCIKDLNSPGFHSSMVSLWVTDSFERENVERDLLTKLLVSLTRSNDGTLSQLQLVKGIQHVLGTLEDAVNDAPKAPEFMGQLLAKLMWENLIQLKEIGKFIYEGGEEPGSLLEAGLAADVLGNLLEAIQLEKGQIFVNQILKTSDLKLETFRPSYPIKSTKLEKFI